MTIEEMATEFAEREYEVGEIDRDALRKGYYWGAKDTMALPLSACLTDAERERVRGIYKDELEAVQYQNRQANSSMNRTCKWQML